MCVGVCTRTCVHVSVLRVKTWASRILGTSSTTELHSQPLDKVSVQPQAQLLYRKDVEEAETGSSQVLDENAAAWV